MRATVRASGRARATKRGEEAKRLFVASTFNMAASRSSSPRFDDADISTWRRLGKVRVSCDVMASNHCLAFAAEVRRRHLAAFIVSGGASTRQRPP